MYLLVKSGKEAPVPTKLSLFTRPKRESVRLGSHLANIWPLGHLAKLWPKAAQLSPGKHLGKVDPWVAGQAWGLAEVQCRIGASQSGGSTWWWWRWTGATTCKGRTWRCSARRRPSCSRPSLTRLARITGRWEPSSLLFPAAEGVQLGFYFRSTQQTWRYWRSLFLLEFTEP